MWGYIDDSGNDGVYQDFPSLYVRVYREKPGFGCSSVVSLTICEGISIPGWFPDHTDTFPHYMWGYIDFKYGFARGRTVPSLYVRVYRSSIAWGVLILGSLIICEGISHPRIWYQIIRMFPHYMWGYIVLGLKDKALTSVPSLYVRVYRGKISGDGWARSSLIICEGISGVSVNAGLCVGFPHYMWGYIGREPRRIQETAVPSLYVRVYRKGLS